MPQQSQSSNSLNQLYQPAATSGGYQGGALGGPSGGVHDPGSNGHIGDDLSGAFSHLAGGLFMLDLIHILLYAL
jgi:hypothetical protein